MNRGSQAQLAAGHAGHQRSGRIVSPGNADRRGVWYVRDDETGATYSLGYADIVTEGFRSLRLGEKVRFLIDPSRPGCARYVVRLDLPDTEEYYR